MQPLDTHARERFDYGSAAGMFWLCLNQKVVHTSQMSINQLRKF